MITQNRPLWLRICCVLFALLFISCFQLRVFAFGEGLLYGGAISLGVQLFYDLMMIGINSSGGMDSIRTSYGNQSLYPSMKDFIVNLGQQFIADTRESLTWQGFLNSFGTDCNYGNTGNVKIGEDTANYIYDFTEWLNDNGYIDVVTETNYSVDNSISSYMNGVLNFPLSLSFGNYFYVKGSSLYDNYKFSGSCFVYGCYFPGSSDSKTWIVFASSDSFTYGSLATSFSDGPSSNNITLNRNSDEYSYNGKTAYYGVRGSYLPNGNLGLGSISLYPMNSNVSYSSYFGPVAWSMVYGASTTSGGAGYDVWNQDDAEDYYIDAPAALQGLGAAADGSIANIQDLLDALADSIAGVSDVSIPVAGSLPISVTIPSDLVIPVDVVAPVDVVIDTPVDGDATEPYPGTEDYTLALADFFPFCIPFDIYRMLSLLAADPVAPAFTWQLYTPGGGTVPIEIDLSGFNSVASVLRTMETLGFCVGLGFITKKLLFGS